MADIAIVSYVHENMCYKDCKNHFTFYSLELRHSLSKLGLKSSFVSIREFKKESYLNMTDCKLFIFIGYGGDFNRIAAMSLPREKVCFISTYPFAEKGFSLLRFTFELRETFEYKELGDSERLVRVPLAKTLSLSKKRESKKLNICIDQPPKSVDWFDLGFQDPQSIYKSLASSFENVFFLSPFKGFYSRDFFREHRPDSTFIEIPSLNAPDLGSFLCNIDHFVIAHVESYGGMVADCLSTETLIHYPKPPVIHGSRSSLNLREPLANCIPFNSADQLIENIKTKTFSNSNKGVRYDVFEIIALEIKDTFFPKHKGF